MYFYFFCFALVYGNTEYDNPELFLNAPKADNLQKIYLETTILVYKDVSKSNLDFVALNLQNFDVYCAAKIKDMFKKHSTDIELAINQKFEELHSSCMIRIKDLYKTSYQMHHFNIVFDVETSDFYKEFHETKKREILEKWREANSFILQNITKSLNEFNVKIINNLNNIEASELELDMDIKIFSDMLNEEIKKMKDIFKDINLKIDKKINEEKNKKQTGIFVNKTYLQNRSTLFDLINKKYKTGIESIVEIITAEKIKMGDDIDFLLNLNNNYKFSKIFGIFKPVDLDGDN